MERESWEEEKKRVGTWKVRCLESEGKLHKRIADLEADYDELKEKYEGVEGELDDLKGCIIQEHISFWKICSQSSVHVNLADFLTS